jgi:hypothetical protein
VGRCAAGGCHRGLCGVGCRLEPDVGVQVEQAVVGEPELGHVLGVAPVQHRRRLLASQQRPELEGAWRGKAAAAA